MQWKHDFIRISEELREGLCGAVISIEHVGSTSVEGLSAKLIIDIDVVIENMNCFQRVCDRLEAIGYKYEGNFGIEGREAFRYEGKEHLRHHHLYVCPKNSKELKRRIAFRDYLRKNKAAAEEYGRIKQEGARLYPDDIDGYIGYKSAFIGRIYEKLGLV